jgi:phosphatidylglycerol:prolipoprotein diacylglycerol transferase
VPPALGFVRIGNFINGELWGAETSPDAPWSVVFQGVARHPTQLYEAFLEGLVMLVVLVWFSAKPRPRMAVSGLFLFLYGVFRFGVEFIRLPDAHIGYEAFGWVTRGQILTVPMIVGGIVLLVLAYGRRSA